MTKSLLGAAALLLVIASVATTGAQSAQPAPAMPQYDRERALILPADYRRWILAGRAPGLWYGEAAPPHPAHPPTPPPATPPAHRVLPPPPRLPMWGEATMLALIVHEPEEAAA